MARPRHFLIWFGVLMALASCSDPAPPAKFPAARPAAKAAPAAGPRTVRIAPEWQSRVPGIEPTQVESTLKQAADALDRGQLEQGSGPGPGALELYLAVLAIAPDNNAAQQGIESTLDALLERGRLTMRAGKLADAERIELIVQSLVASHQDLALFRQALGQARTAATLVEKADAAGRKGRLTAPERDSTLYYLMLARTAFADYQPADLLGDKWNRVILARAWRSAASEDFPAAETALLESSRLSPKSRAARVMELRIIEMRQKRTDGLLAAGNAAVDRLRLDEADRQLAHASRIAAQPSAVQALRDRIYLARHYGPFKPGQVFIDRLRSGGPAPEMVVLPHGNFQMGTAADDPQFREDEAPQHEVRFARGFAIARNEATVGDFARFIKDSGYRSVASREGHSTVYDEKGGVFSEHEGVDWRRDHVGRIASPALPVVHVALQDAQAYARWLSRQTGQRYRLPSEAEFEYALRAGGKGSYPWGSNAPRGVVGNLAGEGDVSRSGRRWGNAIPAYRDAFWGPAPVRNFAPEKFSTFDLVGNVSEWTLDCWHDSYQRAPVDGSAWVNPGCPQRVVRGASWGSSLDQARSAARLPMDADSTTARLGFRLVREI